MLDKTRNIWKECFTDDEDYLDRVLKDCIPYTRTYGLSTSGELACTASVIDLKSEDENCIYLYGVATRPEFRGLGLSSKLFNLIQAEEKKRTGKKILTATHPASSSLYGLYISMGLTDELYYHSENIIIETNDLHIIRDLGMEIIDSTSAENQIAKLAKNLYMTSGKEHLSMNPELNVYALKDLLYNGYKLLTDSLSFAIIYGQNGRLHIKAVSEKSKTIVRKTSIATGSSIISEKTIYGLVSPSYGHTLPPILFLME